MAPSLSSVSGIVHFLLQCPPNVQVFIYNIIRGVNFCTTTDSSPTPPLNILDFNTLCNVDNSMDVDIIGYTLSQNDYDAAVRIKTELKRAMDRCGITHHDLGITILMLNFAQYYMHDQYYLFVYEFTSVYELRLIEDFINGAKRNRCKLPRDLCIHPLYGIRANASKWRYDVHDTTTYENILKQNPRVSGGCGSARDQLDVSSEPLTVRAFKLIVESMNSKNITPQSFIDTILFYNIHIVESFYMLSGICGKNKLVMECMSMNNQHSLNYQLDPFEKEQRLDGGDHVVRILRAGANERSIHKDIVSYSDRLGCLCTTGKPVYWFDLPPRSAWFVYTNCRWKYFSYCNRDTDVLMKNLNLPGVAIGYINDGIINIVSISEHHTNKTSLDNWSWCVDYLRNRGLNCPLRPIVCGLQTAVFETDGIVKVERTYKSDCNVEHMTVDQFNAGGRLLPQNVGTIVTELYDNDIFSAKNPFLVKYGMDKIFKLVKWNK